MKNLILIIILLFSFVACNDNSVTYRKCDIDSQILDIEIPDTVLSNKEYNPKVIFQLWSSCHSLEEISYSFSNDSIYFSVSLCNTQYEGLSCMDAVITSSALTKITFQEKGKFNLIVNDSILLKQIVVE